MSRRFATLDVFTETSFGGNPLAVVLDADGLDTARMQAIAREFNLSETVFVLPARDPVNTARVRIFTPTRELPFAGHPTVGTAVLLAQDRAPEMLGRGALSIVLEEEIGEVRCEVRRHRGVSRATFVLPRLPEPAGESPEAAVLARALSIEPELIGFGRHRPVVMSAGVPYTLVPVRDVATVDRARPDMARWPQDFEPYVYAVIEGEATATVHARMFAPTFGILEDPATGSAAAALAGALPGAEALEDGAHTVLIRQGVAMGRPSVIVLDLDVAGGMLSGASIGGAAVLVSEGVLHA